MNDEERTELERIKQQQAQLETELDLLRQHLRHFEARLSQPESSPTPATPKPAVSASKAAKLVQMQSQEEPKTTAPPTVSQGPPATKSEVSQPAATSLPPVIQPSSPAISRVWPVTPSSPPQSSSAPVKERSFELRLGRHWVPRIGIVMVLTAFVLFGSYAYENFIVRIGPAGKVALLYLASAFLLGAGTWWQRKAAKESLRNYAQVLFAGGLAAVYFTTYAAHHLEPLRVIGSPLLDGGLLLGWAGFMVWIADRKKSEVLALFAVGLAYYTSVITRVGSFTLYSNLVLTVAAVFFLVRNRWAALSFASLVATYVAYGYWRFFNGTYWHWASPGEGLWHGTYFLISYWLVFTAAVFLSRHEKLAGPNRATFLTLNNGEFFVMFLLTMLQVQHAGFWKFSLAYGAVLLGLAELSRRLFTTESLARNSYLTQGLLLVTVGLISNPDVAGLHLALLLGAESVVLLTLGTARKSLILQAGSYITAALAVGWGLDGLERDNWHGVYLDTALGAMMAFNALWSHRQVKRSKNLVRPVPAFFTVLALGGWLATTWYNTSSANFPLALAIETVLLTSSVYLLGVREMALFGQGFLLLAQGSWLLQFSPSSVAPPWWNPVLIIAITLGLSHWWQHQRTLASGSHLNVIWQALYALALVGMLYYWLEPLAAAPAWLVWTSALAVGITAYGAFTGAWLLALCGQIFLAVGVEQFAVQLLGQKPAWYFPLAPVFALGFLSGATVNWFRKRPHAKASIRDPLQKTALVYRWVTLVMSFWWVHEYVAVREQIWVLGSLGLLAFIWAGWRRNVEALLFFAAFSAFGLGLFWVPLHGAGTVYLPNLLAILALLGEQRLARRWTERYPLDSRVHGALIVLGGLSLWLMLYRWLSENATGFYLTATWSALALILFLCGMAFHERMYRWTGLGILAVAVGRVFIFDVWKLQTLYRILSFFALGIVLLVLGFIYSKYQEKIREWL